LFAFAEAEIVDAEDGVDEEAMSDDNDEDSEADNDDDSDDEVDDAVREKVKVALGSAAAHSDVEVIVFCVIQRVHEKTPPPLSIMV